MKTFSPFDEVWVNRRVTTSCCNYMHHVVIPYLHSAAQECPKCGEMDNSPKIECYPDEEKQE
jgi:hypothetical protein